MLPLLQIIFLQYVITFSQKRRCRNVDTSVSLWVSIVGNGCFPELIWTIYDNSQCFFRRSKKYCACIINNHLWSQFYDPISSVSSRCYFYQFPELSISCIPSCFHQQIDFIIYKCLGRGWNIQKFFFVFFTLSAAKTHACFHYVLI